MRVFISYRRLDLGGHASIFVGRVKDQLVTKYGKRNVFMDVDSIPPGEDFMEYIDAQVRKADVLLAVIGPRWAQETSAKAEDLDYVRLEIESALQHGIRIIPVLAGGASMPSAAELPESITPISNRNAVAVDSERDFHNHMALLIGAINAPKRRQISTGAPKPKPVANILLILRRSVLGLVGGGFLGAFLGGIIDLIYWTPRAFLGNTMQKSDYTQSVTFWAAICGAVLVCILLITSPISRPQRKPGQKSEGS